ncbi:protein tyrosine phosphatase, partial [Klebsiella pneumoniae]|nr:protein tyrosine phosphatase [Klebsiella pneumoniae]
MFNSILVVCTGNICRSPLAERLLRKKLPNKKI